MGVHRVQSLGRRLRKNLKAKMNQIQSPCTASRILCPYSLMKDFSAQVVSYQVISSNEKKDRQRSLSNGFLEFLFVFKELMQFLGHDSTNLYNFSYFASLNCINDLSNMKAFARLRLNWCKKKIRSLKDFYAF